MDYRKFYEEQGDYTEFRSDPERQAEYKLKADWKVTNLVSLVPENHKFKNVLEVGCAMGILLNDLASRLGIKDTVGLDISSKNIDSARSLFPSGIFVNGTIEELREKLPAGYPVSIFDLVVLSDIIEHIPDDLGFMKLVNDISGYVLVNLPLEKSFRNRNRAYGESDPSGHLRCYDEVMANELVTKAGFEVVRSFTKNPLSDKSYFKLYKKQRSERIGKKPLPLRIFWEVFYFFEDKLMLVSKKLFVKLNGTNYFALLKSRS
jgi:SAM-dependent methyltransferase